MTASPIQLILLSFYLPTALTTVTLFSATVNSVDAQQPKTQLPATVLLKQADIAVANLYTWQGNVKFEYKPEKIIATADKAEYFSKERKVILTGNVKIYQNEKTQQVETITYFIKDTDGLTFTADSVTTSS